MLGDLEYRDEFGEGEIRRSRNESFRDEKAESMQLNTMGDHTLTSTCEIECDKFDFESGGPGSLLSELCCGLTSTSNEQNGKPASNSIALRIGLVFNRLQVRRK